MQPEITIPPASPWKCFFDALIAGSIFRVSDSNERKRLFFAAKKYGVKVTTNKLNGTGYQVRVVSK